VLTPSTSSSLEAKLDVATAVKIMLVQELVASHRITKWRSK
jgi:hypothetical protein